MKCRLCSTELFTSNSFELKGMPAIAQYLPTSIEESKLSKVDLVIVMCEECKLVQTLNSPPLYFREAIRNSSLSQELTKRRREQFKTFIQKNGLVGEQVLEIGSGQGELLSIFLELGVKVQGTEWNDHYLKFCLSQGQIVTKTYPLDDGFREHFEGVSFRGFYTMQFLEHCPQPMDFLANLRWVLSDGAVGIIEVPNFDTIYSHGLVNEFMADHVTYFSEETLTRLLNSAGFTVRSMESLFHGYILSAQVEKTSIGSLKVFDDKLQSLNAAGNHFLESIKPNKIVVWGAGHQAMANIKLFGLEECIEYVVDSATTKQGKFIPSTEIMIKSPDFLKNDSRISILILMAAGFNGEIEARVANGFPFIRKLFSVHEGNLVELSLLR